MSKDIIFNESIKQYAIVVSKKELIDAVKKRTYEDISNKISDAYTPIKYANPIDTSKIHYVIKEGEPWFYDLIPTLVLEKWKLTPEQKEEAYTREKGILNLLEEALDEWF